MGYVYVGQMMVPSFQTITHKYLTKRFSTERQALHFVKDLEDGPNCLKCGDIGHCAKTKN
jgi:hypothetical protein